MDPFIGQIQPFGFNFAPRSWAKCDGQLLAIASNTALFSLIGTIYGGDGRTTFALPDLRGRLPIHQGTGPGLTSRRIGSKSGTQDNYLSTLQIPSHNHTAVMKTASLPSTESPDNAYPAQMVGRANTGAVQLSGWGPSKGTGSLNTGAIVVGNTGGNQPVQNMKPWLTINYCIALQGIFPSRN